MFLVVLLDVVHELLALKILDDGGKADSNSYSGLKASIFDVFSPLSDIFQYIFLWIFQMIRTEVGL